MKIQLILCLFLVILILFIYKIQTETFFAEDSDANVHNKVSCKDYPFEYDSKCDSIYHDEIYTPHINNFILKDSIPTIHMVDPNNPCCLRTCINDFTITPENSDPRTKPEYGNLKPFLNNSDNLDTLQLSQCDQCIKNFSQAMKILKQSKKRCSR